MKDQYDDDGLFVPREKTKDEQEREEEEYQAFLEREVGEDLQALVTIDANDELVGDLTDRGVEDVKMKQRKKKTKAVKMANDESHRNSTQDSDQKFLRK